jgi:hypothetical protein
MGRGAWRVMRGVLGKKYLVRRLALNGKPRSKYLCESGLDGWNVFALAQYHICSVGPKTHLRLYLRLSRRRVEKAFISIQPLLSQADMRPHRSHCLMFSGLFQISHRMKAPSIPGVVESLSISACRSDL